MKPPSEDNFSLEEKLRRETQRQHFTGITSYQWANDTLLVPVGDELYVQDGIDGTPRLLFPAFGSLVDPKMSADGKVVGFVHDKEVYVVPTDGSQPPAQVTSGARGTALSHGLADFLAMEEMDRYTGFWLSPDAEWLVFEEVDQDHIPEYRIMHHKDEVGAAAQEDHRYPFAGGANPKVRLGAVRIGGGRLPLSAPVWFDGILDVDGEEGYLAKVHWLGNDLALEVLDRKQARLDIVKLDLTTGDRRTLLKEESPYWINLNDGFKPLKGGGFVWASESSGFRHLSVHGPDGKKLRQLTSGAWQVDSLEAVDEAKNLVYFSASCGANLERNLFVADLNAENQDSPRRLTPRGFHNVTVDAKAGLFVDQYSTAGQPMRAELRDLQDGAARRTLFEAAVPPEIASELVEPELFTTPTRDGTATLIGSVLVPDKAKFGPGPYPTVVYTYGGPHVQLVCDAFTSGKADMRSQFLRSQGYLVMKLDNRGSMRRGIEFEGAIKHDMGRLEIQDQVAGVEHLVQRGLCDPRRVGIMGWSYGGYMSLMALGLAPDVFKTAVAGAPVTHWDGYDTCYTERYMGTPESNPLGYEVSSPLHHVGNIRGSVMLVHGLIDENVHFRHTARMVRALTKAKRPYELLVFPDERHSPRSQEDRAYMEEQIFRFLQRTL